MRVLPPDAIILGVVGRAGEDEAVGLKHALVIVKPVLDHVLEVVRRVEIFTIVLFAVTKFHVGFLLFCRSRRAVARPQPLPS